MKLQSVKVVWRPDAYFKLISVPDKMVQGIARMTLDRAIPVTPKDTGRMRNTALSRGVFKYQGSWAIGNFTNYSATVYDYPDTVHWTTPGTGNQWYMKTWKRQGMTITNTVVTQERLK